MTIIDSVNQIIEVPRETHELIPVEVKRDGVVITVGLEFSVVSGSTRPTSWTNMIDALGKTCIEIDGLSTGMYRVYVRIPSASESPVIEAGRIKVI